MGDYPVEGCNLWNTKSAQNAKTGVPMALEMIVRRSQIWDCNGCHQNKNKKATWPQTIYAPHHYVFRSVGGNVGNLGTIESCMCVCVCVCVRTITQCMGEGISLLFTHCVWKHNLAIDQDKTWEESSINKINVDQTEWDHNYLCY